ncbi:sulfurtransferase TusA family protein [Roseicyclus persicicus]|uniref:sulfurtransferase TusA family protein n=1 Tax=Roseicyclus persicicus TaxID=2650661 RepID=UPI003084148A
MDWDVEIDAQGLRCPLPVLRLRQRLAVLRAGQVVRLVADDPMAAVDVPHFCAEGGHRLVGQVAEGAGDGVFRGEGVGRFPRGKRTGNLEISRAGNPGFPPPLQLARQLRLWAQDADGFGVAEDHDLPRVLDGAEAPAIDLLDEFLAPEIALDVPERATDNLAVADQLAAEDIGQKSLGGFVRGERVHAPFSPTFS